MNKNHLLSIIKAGHQGPSADNCQPWQFAINPHSILIYHNKEKTHTNHIYNIGYFADFISLGMVIENMTVQAEYLNYQSEVFFLSQGTDGSPVAEIFFKGNSFLEKKQFPKLHYLIKKRKTNRKAYKKKNLAKNLKKEFEEIAQKKGANIHWISENKKIKDFAKVIASHDSILWQDFALRKNLLRMLRFGDNYLDGLSIKSLELGPKRYFFSLFISLANHLPILWPLISLGSIQHTKKKITNSGELVLITMPQEKSFDTYMKRGQVFQSVWLNFTEKNLHLQPLFGPLAFLLNGQLKKGGLSLRHEKIRQKLEKYFLKEFPQLEKETAIAFFRVGYAKNPSAFSNRKPISEVMKIENI